jgi:hypothetical protein
MIANIRNALIKTGDDKARLKEELVALHQEVYSLQVIVCVYVCMRVVYACRYVCHDKARLKEELVALHQEVYSLQVIVCVYVCMRVGMYVMTNHVSRRRSSLHQEVCSLQVLLYVCNVCM